MELQYEWTVDDWKTYALRPQENARSGPRQRRATYIVLGLMGVAAAVAVATWMVRDSIVGASLNVIVIAVLPMAVFKVILWLGRHDAGSIIEDQLEGQPHSMPVTLTLGPSGISLQTPITSKAIVWSAVVRSQDWPEQLSLRCGHAGDVIIPKRAFQSEQQMRAFLDEVNAYRSQALLSGAPPVG